MTGLNRYDGKDKRRQRRRNYVAKDLASGKYKQKVIPNRRRVDNEDGSFYLVDEYYVDQQWDDEYE